MSKAEDLASKEWKDLGFVNNEQSNAFKLGYLKGYHQAEKDNELTWEDIETIQEIANEYCKHHSCEPRFFVYKEVLRRFKDYKEKKEK